ncbi:MAG TPA: hypothetical protein VGM24_06085 [Puia sp.]|jgi:hypothetical protein
MRKIKWVLGMLALVAGSSPGFAQSAGNIDRTAFYQAIRQDKKDLVNEQLKILKMAPAELRQAFEGALTMKKAGLGGSPPQKLKLFRQGRHELEAAIKRDQNNVEYRFLRLIIQENSPAVLGYRDDLPGDRRIIEKSYKTLPGELQRVIEDYSKKSKILKLQVS